VYGIKKQLHPEENLSEEDKLMLHFRSEAEKYFIMMTEMKQCNELYLE